MLGFLKRHKKDDYGDLEDIRSNVLGNDFLKTPEPDFPRPPTTFNEPRRVADRFPGIEQPHFEEPPGFSSVDTRFPDRTSGQDRQNNYDIMDRLNLIESQLAAIRSQTETINERLKNMERSIGRRY